MALDDYAALIASGKSLVPDYTQSQANDLALSNARLQNQAAKMAIVKAGLEAQRLAGFQTDLQTMLADPTASNVSALMMKYPEQADSIKKGWDVKDKSTRDADFTQLSEIWSALDNGNPALAAKSARSRYDAEVAAGTADDTDKAVVDALESGDPAKIAQVKGMIGMQVQALAGPEHFGSVSDALNPKPMSVAPGADVIDPKTNKLLYSSPYKPQIWTDPTSGITYQLRPAQGGGQSGTAPAPASGGGLSPAKLWSDFILPHEGGYSATDGNGAAVNFGINQKANPDVDVSKLTAPEAQQLFIERYWKPSGADKLPPALAAIHADTYFINPDKAQTFLEKSGGDPNKYMQLRESWLNSLSAKPQYARFKKAWTSRNAALREYAGNLGGGYYNQDESDGGVPHVATKADYDKLPSGSHYYAPDGSLRVKG